MGQPGQGGLGALPPEFLPAVVFNIDADLYHPYGLASADFLNASGNAGQDGYPEIAVAGAGLDICDFGGASTDCNSEPDPFGFGTNSIKIYHNRGATVNWSGLDGPDPDSDPDDPHDALALVQTLSITAANEHMWAMEMVFADVTGQHGPDLVLVGADPDAGEGWRGFLVIYKNLGTGLFDPVPSVIPLPDVELRSIVAADLDLDGDIDLAAAANDLRGIFGGCSPGAQNVVVVFENETVDPLVPAFTLHPVPLDTPSGSPSADIAIADFVSLAPGQPLPDLVTGDPSNASVSAITNLGLMSFDPDNADPPLGCDPGYYFTSVAGGRFGADLHADIAGVHNQDIYTSRVYVEVLHGNGTGAFQAICADPPGYRIAPILDEGDPIFAHGIDTANFNGDPYPDLAVAAFYLQFATPPQQPSNIGFVAAISGKSDGTFRTRADGACFPFDTLQQQTVNVMAVDLDADGLDDVVAANHTIGGDNKYTFSVLINSISIVVTPAGPP